MHSINRRVGAGAVIAATAALLAACSSGSVDHPEPERSATAATSSRQPELEKVHVECKDGTAVITDAANNKQVDLGDCGTVTVDASNAAVTLGDVDKLVVHSTISGIEAGTVHQLQITGNGNIVTTENPDVQVDDSGQQNQINQQ